MILAFYEFLLFVFNFTLCVDIFESPKLGIMKFLVVSLVFILPSWALSQIDTVVVGERLLMSIDREYPDFHSEENRIDNRIYKNLQGPTGFGSVRNFSSQVGEKSFSKLMTKPCGEYSVRFDGHNYATVQIGSQCWFAENLRSERFANGDSLASGVDGNWLTEGATMVYGDSSSFITTLVEGSENVEGNLANHGRLYTWSAVNDDRELCPPGWHVPSDYEWSELARFLGGESIAGSKLKSSVSDSPGWNGTNESGFSGTAGGRAVRVIIPSGGINLILYQGENDYSSWWTSGPSEPVNNDLPMPTTSYNPPPSTRPIRAIGGADAISRGLSSDLESRSVRCISNNVYVNDCVDVEHDGYVYETIQIGGKCWFAENLRAEHYANGDEIPGGLNDSEWTSTTSGAQSIYAEGASAVYSSNTDEIANLETYGRLYNWYAVNDSRGLCPSGWHVPSDWEWRYLVDLQGPSIAGAALKASPSDTPSWNGTNTSGFAALPGGERWVGDGAFGVAGAWGHWWSASLAESTSAWSVYIDGSNEVLFNDLWDLRSGLSIRCVRD